MLHKSRVADDKGSTDGGWESRMVCRSNIKLIMRKEARMTYEKYAVSTERESNARNTWVGSCLGCEECTERG